MLTPAIVGSSMIMTSAALLHALVERIRTTSTCYYLIDTGGIQPDFFWTLRDFFRTQKKSEKGTTES